MPSRRKGVGASARDRPAIISTTRSPASTSRSSRPAKTRAASFFKQRYASTPADGFRDTLTPAKTDRVKVLAGSVTVRVGGKDRTLGVGDTADVPRRKVHVLHNAGPGDASFLLEVRPARRMELAIRGLFRFLAVLRPFARFRQGPSR